MSNLIKSPCTYKTVERWVFWQFATWVDEVLQVDPQTRVVAVRLVEVFNWDLMCVLA